MSDSRPIGIFDSGLGGLTVAKEIYKLLPHESTIYIGDTARVPYGNRSPETVIQFARETIEVLLGHNVKAVVIACGTASSVALDTLHQDYLNLPILGVIQPAAEAAATITNSKHIGIIGTQATIQSRSFDNALTQIDSTLTSYSRSCPLFVPIVEEGIPQNHPILTETIKYYLSDLSRAPIDTLILGCTHYPIIKTAIQSFLPKVKLLNTGIPVANELKQLLTNNHLENKEVIHPFHSYFVTDINPNFHRIAKAFLNQTITIEKISL